MKIVEEKVLAETPFARFVELEYEDFKDTNKKWFGVRRSTPQAVIIVAITEDEEIILVKQPRPLIASDTIEFPAGLLDIDGEGTLETAVRELMEETGFEVKDAEVLIGGDRGLVNSPGITDERVSLVVASGAVKVREPLANEQTKPLLLPIDTAYETLLEMSKSEEVGYKVFGNLLLLKQWYAKRKDTK
ncbi:MAG: NUDIX hydrolase [bacterium]|nr:NUDIX hydrolase [bacterium]